ncbi:hypothetical protein Ciccas_002894 [Cichlidogyrus casuarinus]|uniref:Vacuolar protein sorting-associated protein 13 DH-like domain-containing protein n=1 Tax=Cichlidogyrus casuarinus TaxID=1844966 RepID=A0ABD2QGJ7_9PLAT
MNDLTMGISGLVEGDFSGLIRNVAHGVGDSTAKVAGSFSQLVSAIGLDENHQEKRAEILRKAYLSDNVNVSAASQKGSGAKESLDDFQITCSGFQQKKNMQLATNSRMTDISSAAPFTAGLKGLVHGFYGGITSLASQTYYGAREDSMKGFFMGAGRGILGTVTKPVGGMLDLVSGVMFSVREFARSSNPGRPRKRRPRRSGLALQSPMPAYRLFDAVAQLQLFRLLSSGMSKPNIVGPKQMEQDQEDSSTSSDELEDVVQRRKSNYLNLAGRLGKTSSKTRPISRILSLTTGFDESQESATENVSSSEVALAALGFSDTESTLILLPCQSSGIVAVITDRSLWCIRDFSISFEQYSFSPLLNDHCEVLFILAYPRLDGIHIAPVLDDATANSSTQSYYINFVGDAGTSTRVLRCDKFEWALNISRHVGEAHFRFMQAAMSLNRRRLFVNIYSDQLLNHPLAMIHAPPPCTHD